jgi:Txe/YoeB family toxin of Txe-Axe toxin-antitoxin module
MQVRFTNLFVKQIGKVQDSRLAKRIEDAITEVKNANSLSEITHFKKLKGYSNAYRKKYRRLPDWLIHQ